MEYHQTELADFQSKVGERKRLDGEWLYNLGKGKQMYAVGVDGVNNTLVISDGNYENPSIEKVYHIGLNNETDIEVLRDEIYKREKDSERTLSSDVITNLFADEPIGAYRIEDFFDYQTMREEYEGTKGKRNTRNSQNVQNRGRSNPKTQYSVNDTKTPNNGVFFDEKTQFSVSEIDSWLDDLSIEDLMDELRNMGFSKEDLAYADENNTATKKPRVKRRVDEVNKRLKEIGLRVDVPPNLEYHQTKIAEFPHYSVGQSLIS